MNRKFVLGCAGVVLFVIGAIAIGVFVVAPRLVKTGKSWLHAQVESTAHRTAIESAWQPPSPRPDAAWFPAVVEKWALQSSADITTVPDLQLDRPGRRGKYRGENQDVEVTVIPVSDLELDGILSRAAATLAEQGKRVLAKSSEAGSFRIETAGSQMTTRTPGRLYVRLRGDNRTRLWWIKDWLFMFRTVGPEDPDGFAEKYLEAMQP